MLGNAEGAKSVEKREKRARPKFPQAPATQAVAVIERWPLWGGRGVISRN